MGLMFKAIPLVALVYIADPSLVEAASPCKVFDAGELSRLKCELWLSNRRLDYINNPKAAFHTYTMLKSPDRGLEAFKATTLSEKADALASTAPFSVGSVYKFLKNADTLNPVKNNDEFYKSFIRNSDIIEDIIQKEIQLRIDYGDKSTKILAKNHPLFFIDNILKYKPKVSLFDEISKIISASPDFINDIAKIKANELNKSQIISLFSKPDILFSSADRKTLEKIAKTLISLSTGAKINVYSKRPTDEALLNLPVNVDEAFLSFGYEVLKASGANAADLRFMVDMINNVQKLNKGFEALGKINKLSESEIANATADLDAIEITSMLNIFTAILSMANSIFSSPKEDRATNAILKQQAVIIDMLVKVQRQNAEIRKQIVKLKLAIGELSFDIEKSTLSLKKGIDVTNKIVLANTEIINNTHKDAVAIKALKHWHNAVDIIESTTNKSYTKSQLLQIDNTLEALYNIAFWHSRAEPFNREAVASYPNYLNYKNSSVPLEYIPTILNLFKATNKIISKDNQWTKDLSKKYPGLRYTLKKQLDLSKILCKSDELCEVNPTVFFNTPIWRRYTERYLLLLNSLPKSNLSAHKKDVQRLCTMGQQMYNAHLSLVGESMKVGEILLDYGSSVSAWLGREKLKGVVGDKGLLADTSLTLREVEAMSKKLELNQFTIEGLLSFGSAAGIFHPVKSEWLLSKPSPYRQRYTAEKIKAGTYDRYFGAKSDACLLKLGGVNYTKKARDFIDITLIPKVNEMAEILHYGSAELTCLRDDYDHTLLTFQPNELSVLGSNREIFGDYFLPEDGMWLYSSNRPNRVWQVLDDVRFGKVVSPHFSGLLNTNASAKLTENIISKYVHKVLSTYDKAIILDEKTESNIMEYGNLYWTFDLINRLIFTKEGISSFIVRMEPSAIFQKPELFAQMEIPQQNALNYVFDTHPPRFDEALKIVNRIAKLGSGLRYADANLREGLWLLSGFTFAKKEQMGFDCNLTAK